MIEYTEEFIRSLGAWGFDTDALMRENTATGRIECLERDDKERNKQ